MAKLLTDERKVNELGDEAINASSSAFSYFFTESKDSVNLENKII